LIGSHIFRKLIKIACKVIENFHFVIAQGDAMEEDGDDPKQGHKVNPFILLQTIDKSFLLF
jgi:hypothetical protein